MFEKPSSTIYDNYFIDNCNRVLAELFDENNMSRLFRGKSELMYIPQITDMTDEIEYEDEYMYDVIPKGIAAYFLIDDDLQKYGIYNTDYQNARIKYAKLVPYEEV